MNNINKNKLICLVRRASCFSLMLFCVVAVVVGARWSFSPKKAFAADGIKIAAVFSLTGIAAVDNAPMVRMVELAVDSINHKGGVLGRSLELVILDNKSTPIGSAQAAQKAVDMGVIAVIGCHWSSHSLAMAPILQKSGVPMIAPASTNPAVTQDRSYVFRACFIDSFQGKAMAKFARESLKARRAVVLSNVDEEYSSTLAHFFRESFEKSSGEVIADIQYRGDAVDFSEIISKIKYQSPDVIYIPGYSRDSGLFIKQARKLGVRAVFLGGDGWEDVVSFAGDTINGSYHTAAWHPMVPYPSSLKLREELKMIHNVEIMNFNSPLAYDAIMLLKNAIETCGSTEKRKIRDSLLAMGPFQGATGVITFDDQGNPEQKQVIIVQFQDNLPMYVQALRP